MNFLKLISLALVLALNACSPFLIANTASDPPIPIIESQPAATESQSASVDAPTSGYQPVAIDNVEVEVGVGSPIPVFIHASGTLPDTCAQVEYMDQKQEGSSFIIKLGTVPSEAEGCIADALPFQMSIPLNMIDSPAGSYTVEVNGTHADFKMDSGDPKAGLPAADAFTAKSDIQVDDVSMDIGVGSPIPVHAIVSGSLPNACAQLGEIRLHRAQDTFFVQLIAIQSANMDCDKNSAPPFRLEIPLNIVGLSAGTYQVNVNGAATAFDIPIK